MGQPAATGLAGGQQQQQHSGLLGPGAPPALVDGSRVRLRVTGGLRLSAVRDEGAAARRQAGLTGEGGYLFTGVFVCLGGVRDVHLCVRGAWLGSSSTLTCCATSSSLGDCPPITIGSTACLALLLLYPPSYSLPIQTRPCGA